MKVIVAGSRDVGDYQAVDYAVHRSGFAVDEVVSGGAIGVDRLGELWAQENGKPIKRFLPDWGKHGLSAGPIRNRQMADYADALVAIWDGESRGTKNMIETMQRRSKPVWVEYL